MDSDDSTADILAANLDKILMWIVIGVIAMMIFSAIAGFMVWKYHG